MLRYFIKNISGLSTRTDASPHRYRSRLFRSLSPALRYGGEKKEQEVESRSLSQRSRSCTRSKSISSPPLNNVCLTKIDDNLQRHVSQINKYHRKHENSSRVQIENKYGQGSGETNKSEYYEESQLETKFYTGVKYELEAARPRQLEPQINIIEKMQELDKENGEPTTQYLQPRHMRPFGSKQIFTPIVLKTKRLHSVNLPKIVKEKRTSAKSEKNNSSRRNYSTSTIFKQKYQNPISLIYNLPVSGYNKSRMLPKPKKFNHKKQTGSASLEEKETNERIKKKLKSMPTNILSDDLFHESLKKLQNFKSIVSEKKNIVVKKPTSFLKKKFFAQSNISVDVRMKSSFAANVNPPNVTKNNSATYKAEPSFERQLHKKQSPHVEKLNFKALRVNESSKSVAKPSLNIKSAKNRKPSLVIQSIKKNNNVSSRQFQPKVFAVTKKNPTKSHISLNSEFGGDKSKVKKHSRLDKEKNKFLSSPFIKNDTEENSQHGLIKHNSTSPTSKNFVNVTEKASVSSHANPIEKKTSTLFAKMKSNAKNKQEIPISNGRIEKNRSKVKIVKANLGGMSKASDPKLTGNQAFQVNNTKVPKYTTPTSSFSSVLNIPSINRLNRAKLVEINEKKSNHILCLHKQKQNVQDIEHSATHSAFDKRRDTSFTKKEEIIEPTNVKNPDSKKSYENSTTFKNIQEDYLTQPESRSSNPVSFKSTKITTKEEDGLNQTINLQPKISKSTLPVSNMTLRIKEDSLPIQLKPNSKDCASDVEEKSQTFIYEKDSSQSTKPKTESKNTLLMVHPDTQCKDLRNNNNIDSSKTAKLRKDRTFTLAQSLEYIKPKSISSKSNMLQNTQNKGSKFPFLHENRSYESNLVNNVTKPEIQEKTIISKSGCQAYFESHPFKDIVNHIFPRSERSNQRLLKSTMMEPIAKIDFQDTTTTKSSRSNVTTVNSKKTPNKSVFKKVVDNSSKTEVNLIRNDTKSSNKSKTDVNLTPHSSEHRGHSDIKQAETKNRAYKSFLSNPQHVNDFSKKTSFLRSGSRENNQEQSSKINTPNMLQLNEAAKKILTHKAESDSRYVPRLHPKVDIQESSTKMNTSVSKNTQQLSEATKRIMLQKSDAQSFLDSLPRESGQESSSKVEIQDTRITQQLTESAKKNMMYKSDNQSFLHSVPKGSGQESPPKLDTQLTQLSAEYTKKAISYKPDKYLLQKEEYLPKVEVEDSQNTQQLTECDNRNVSYKTEQSFLDSLPRRDKQGVSSNKNVQDSQFEQQITKSTKKTMLNKSDNHPLLDSLSESNKQELPPKVDIQEYRSSQKIKDTAKKNVLYKYDNQHFLGLSKLNTPPKYVSQETRIVNQLTEAAKKVIAYNNECQSFLDQPLSKGGQQKNSELSSAEMETSKISKQHFLVQAPQGGAIRDLQDNVTRSPNSVTPDNHNNPELQKVANTQSKTTNILTRTRKNIEYISEYQHLFTKSSKTGVNSYESSKRDTLHETPGQNSFQEDEDTSCAIFPNDHVSTHGSITRCSIQNSVTPEFGEKFIYLLRTTPTISPSISCEKLNLNPVSSKMFEKPIKNEVLHQKPVDLLKNCKQNELPVSVAKMSTVEKNRPNDGLVKTKLSTANISTKVSPSRERIVPMKKIYKLDKFSSRSDFDSTRKNCSLIKPEKTFIIRNISKSQASEINDKLQRKKVKSSLKGSPRVCKLGTTHGSTVLLNKLSTESLAIRAYNSCSKATNSNIEGNRKKFLAPENKISHLNGNNCAQINKKKSCVKISDKYLKKSPPNRNLSDIIESSEYSNECRTTSKLQTDSHRYSNNSKICETAKSTSYLDESQTTSDRLNLKEDKRNSNKINTLFISLPTNIIETAQPTLQSRMFSTISKNVAASRQLRKSKHGIYQKQMFFTPKTYSKARRSQKNAMIKRVGLLYDLMREKSCQNSQIKLSYATLKESMTEDLADEKEKTLEEKNNGLKDNCQQKICRPQKLEQMKLDNGNKQERQHCSNNKLAPCRLDNSIKQQNCSLDTSRYNTLNIFTKRIEDIKSLCTYLPKQLFLVFGMQQRSLYNIACNQNCAQEDDDATKLPLNANSERSYHFLCKKAERKLTPQSEFKSDFKNEFSVLEEGSPFNKICNLQWRINNFQKWHRLNKLTNCQYNHIKRYYSSMTNVDVSQSFSTVPDFVPGKSSSYILNAYEKLLESKKNSKSLHFNEMFATTKRFEQNKQLASTKSVRRRTDKKYSNYLTKSRKKSVKFAGSDECSCMNKKGKLLQPQYPILPELERVAAHDTLFPDPVNTSVKVEYMRHKYGIPKTGVTLDCNSFQDAVSSGQLKIKNASKPQIECDENINQMMPQVYCANEKNEVICDPKNKSVIDSPCKAKCPEPEKKLPKLVPSNNCCNKSAPPPESGDKCKIKKAPSIWRRIIDYFKARPNCPAPDAWKKKAAREKAERYAKAAGLCLCEPCDLKPKSCQIPVKSLVSKQITKKPTENKSECPKEQCKELPRVITCPPPTKRSYSFVTNQNSSQGYYHHRSLSMSSMTSGDNRNKCHSTYPYLYATNNINGVQRKYFSTTTKLKKSSKYNSDDSKESNQYDNLSTNSNQELIGDTFKEVSQNLIDAENEKHELKDENKSDGDDKSMKSGKGATKLSEKHIHVIPKRCYSEKGRNRHIDDLNRTLEEKERQKLAERIIRSLLEVSINHQDTDNIESQCLEQSDQKHGNDLEDDYLNSPYKFLSRKTSLSDIMFREPIDEYMKYCQAQSFANFIEGFHKMEVLSDVNYEDIEKMKTNKLVNELNKLIIDKNQSKK